MAGRPCKICQLEDSNPEVYQKITNQIEKGGKLSMAKFVKKLNDDFGLGIIEMNVSRHKAHYLERIKSKKKPQKRKKSSKKAPAEMEVYSKDGELLYTNIQEIIDDLEDKEKLFCELYVNTHNHNGTGAYLQAYQADSYGAAATGASRLVKKTNIQLYINHLNDERSKKLKVSSSFVITGLMENYFRCMQAEPIIGADGEPIGIYKHNPNAANKALELIGKHLDMWEKGSAQGDQKQTYDKLIQRMADNEISPVMALFELAKEKLPFQDMAKVLLAKADLTQITEGPKREGDNLRKASTNELENRLRLISNKKDKLKCS